MKWNELAQKPEILEHSELLKQIGILDYIEEVNSESKALDTLVQQAYEIFIKETVEELIDLIIQYLSEIFIPSNLIFVLNEGIMVNKIKVMYFKNMKAQDTLIPVKSLEPFEKTFQTYSGTTSFLILENEMEDSDSLSVFKPFKPEIVVPIKGLSGLYGMIFFGQKILSEEYTAREISYIDKLMHFTSIGIQNTIHYDNSVKDPKTGLYNHNIFVHRVNEQMARARRLRKPFSIIVMDIDKFKYFNDTYGHLAGDEVILNLARVLKSSIREGDILSRFGGEEFTVLLPYSGRKEAWAASERFRKAVEAMTTEYNGEILKVTISLGIATFNYYEDPDEKNLIKRADKALYQSKKNGRNMSSFYKSGLLQLAKAVEDEAAE